MQACPASWIFSLALTWQNKHSKCQNNLIKKLAWTSRYSMCLCECVSLSFTYPLYHIYFVSPLFHDEAYMEKIQIDDVISFWQSILNLLTVTLNFVFRFRLILEEFIAHIRSFDISFDHYVLLVVPHNSHVIYFYLESLSRSCFNSDGVR